MSNTAKQPADRGSKEAKERMAATQFKPGQSGCPTGRPKGARSKLGEDFLRTLQEDFQEYGKGVVEAVREDKPEVYMKIVASLLPKEFKISVDPLDDLTDEDLNRYIKQLSIALREETGISQSTPEQTQASLEQPAKDILPIH